MKLLYKLTKVFLILPFLLSFSVEYGLAKKHVIGGWGAGFGNVFLGALHHLAYCDENGINPVVYWDNVFPYYQPGYKGLQNAWEYYFEPTSSEKYENGDYVDRRFTPDRYRLGEEERFDKASRKEGRRILDKYVKVVAPLQKKIDDFYEKNMSGKKTIGIHLRGTDIWIEFPPTDPMLIIEEANKQADQIGECQFLVATDEHRFLEMAKKELKRPVIYYDCQRSYNKQPIVFAGNPEPQHWAARKWAHDAQQGEDFLIEFILLSKCFLFIHSQSNAAALPFYFNPGLLGIYFNPQGKIIYF